MKNVFVFTMLFLSITLSKAQQGNNQGNGNNHSNNQSSNTITPAAIRLMPYEATRFVVMNHAAHPTVSRWEVIISQKTQNQAGNVSYNTVRTYNLNAKHYVQLPATYLSRASNNHYYVAAKGYDSNNILVIEDLPKLAIDGPVWTEACAWTCVGDDYAYDLTMYVNPPTPPASTSSSSRLILERSYDYYDADLEVGIPHYEYMTAADLATKDAAGMASYYNVPALIYGYPGTSTSIIKLEDVPSSDPLYDAHGVALSGTVYGVQKYLGDWAGPVITSPEMASGDENCGQLIGWAIDGINMSSDFGSRPDVECTSVGAPSGGPSSTSGLSTATSLTDCFKTHFIDGIPSGDMDFAQNITDIQDCLDAAGSNGNTTTGIYPSELAAITYQPCSPSNNGSVITLTESDFADRNGNYVSPTITLPAGLVAVSYQMKNNTVVTLYTELDNNYVGQLEARNLVAVNIYQVPITNNRFTLELDSRIQTSCQYELFDFSGNLLHSERIPLTAGQLSTTNVRPAQGIPTGQLVNKFTFPDGSVITKLTNKQ